MTKKSKKIPWIPKWNDETVEPEDRQVVITKLSKNIPDPFDKEGIVVNYKIDGKWSILFKNEEELPLWWRIFSPDDYNYFLKKSNGYVLKKYISGEYKKYGFNIEKLFGIKIEENNDGKV